MGRRLLILHAVLLVALLLAPSRLVRASGTLSSALQEMHGLDCAATGGSFAALPIGTKLTVECPAGCTRLSFWGDGTYTDDSAICTAGAHMGVINFEKGGIFAIQISAGKASYPSTTRNNLTSDEYGGWPRSFTVLSTTAQATKDPLTGNLVKAENKAAVCQILQRNQKMLSDETPQLNTLIDFYTKRLQALDDDLAKALDEYVACIGNCSEPLFHLEIATSNRSYGQGQLDTLRSLLGKNRTSQESNSKLVDAIKCAAK